MRVRTLIYLSLAVAAGARSAQGQSFEPGTIAVLPFGVQGNVRGAQSAWASSVAIASILKDVLSEGQRFTSVLDRTGDAAILDELQRTESVWNSGSAVQVAQDGQLNANYVAYGFIMSQTFDPGNACARIEFTVEISDVSTGETVLSDVFAVDNDRAPGPVKLCTEASEATALSMARGRVDDKVREEIAKDFGKRFGYRLVDMRERNGALEVLIRASDDDPSRGTDMIVLVTATSAFGETYTEELGRMEVLRVERDVAYAAFETAEQAEAFVAHVTEHGPRSVQVKRR